MEIGVKVSTLPMESPLWVKSRHRPASCPSFPSKRTFISAVRTSALCQLRTCYCSHHTQRSGPRSLEDGKLNDWNGGRGFYYKDHDGHVIELMTVPQ